MQTKEFSLHHVSSQTSPCVLFKAKPTSFAYNTTIQSGYVPPEARASSSLMKHALQPLLNLPTHGVSGLPFSVLHVQVLSLAPLNDTWIWSSKQCCAIHPNVPWRCDLNIVSCVHVRSWMFWFTHTHTHKERDRERERKREKEGVLSVWVVRSRWSCTFSSTVKDIKILGTPLLKTSHNSQIWT